MFTLDKEEVVPYDTGIGPFFGNRLCVELYDGSQSGGRRGCQWSRLVWDTSQVPWPWVWSTRRISTLACYSIRDNHCRPMIPLALHLDSVSTCFTELVDVIQRKWKEQ